MWIKNLLILLFFVFAGWESNAQGCTTLGQTPSTAFPVCGTNIFSQATVPQCTNSSVPAGTCGSYPDTNPFWYQFTCFQSGTLGFLITPNDLDDDYDWELFDITNHSPSNVYDSSDLIVAYNWSGNTSLESAQGYTGVTGAAPSGSSNFACATNPQALGFPPPYSNASTINKMPQIIKGHVYLLLVSHYTQTQSGYQLTFSGGTAVITDPTIPSLQSASIQCNAQTISIKTNKQVRCSSVAPDGSDFSISYPSSSIISAVGFNCGNGFDVDSIILTLNNPLPPGNYTVTMQTGDDGNTLLDDCNNNIAVGDNVPLIVIPLAPTPLDSITPVGCSPNILQLVFNKPIQCSSIAPDGSDFTITGPTPVTIQSATGNCTNNLSNSIVLQLNQPIVSAGVYQITLVKGTDGNTIIDACNQQTPAGSTISFTTVDTVSAQFNYQVMFGCKYDSIQFNDPGGNGINKWQWTFDSTANSSLQNPLFDYFVFGQKYIQLVVTNGVCSDTSSVNILLNNTLKAAFTTQDTICPEDKITFQNNSIGNIVSWYWDFGDGTSSTEQTPSSHSYALSTSVETIYTIHLIVQDNLGCYDTATQLVTQLRSCYITVPSAFTPNGDGLNDYLYPLNGFKAASLEFRVYNRYGQLVFETRDWSKKWDGTINGKPQDTGTYVWMLQYTDKDTGKNVFLKGTSVLIR